MVESADPVTIHLSIGENLTHQIPLLCPRKTPICSPDFSFATYEKMFINLLCKRKVAKLRVTFLALSFRRLITVCI